VASAHGVRKGKKARGVRDFKNHHLKEFNKREGVGVEGSVTIRKG